MEEIEELKKELAFTEEDLKELEQARKMPITFDEDCPEISPEKAIKFRRVTTPHSKSWRSRSGYAVFRILNFIMIFEELRRNPDYIYKP